MRGVCARAGLNDRYFYEGFKTRDELLVAAWDGVRNDMLGEVAALFNERANRPPIETITAAITIVVDGIARDAGRARILLAQYVGSSPLQDRRAVALQEATQLVVEASRPHPDKMPTRWPFAWTPCSLSGGRQSHQRLALGFARGDREGSGRAHQQTCRQRLIEAHNKASQPRGDRCEPRLRVQAPP